MNRVSDIFIDSHMLNGLVEAGFTVVRVGLLLVSLVGAAIVVFALLCYFLQSQGLYQIAKRRGIRNGWLTWIPVVNLWILGSISDQYQYVVKGRIKNRRKILLGLRIASVILSGFCGVIAFAIGIAAGITGNAEALVLTMLTPVLVWAIGVAATVVRFVAYYDLYRSCDPDDSVLLLVLSILFPVAIPFFVFSQRKKDQGMPPRKDAAKRENCPEEEYIQLPDAPVAQPEEFEDYEDV